MRNLLGRLVRIVWASRRRTVDEPVEDGWGMKKIGK
jgi:hypothetical protein